MGWAARAIGTAACALACLGYLLLAMEEVSRDALPDRVGVAAARAVAAEPPPPSAALGGNKRSFRAAAAARSGTTTISTTAAPEARTFAVIIADLRSEDHPWILSFQRLPEHFGPVLSWMPNAAKTMGADARRPTAKEMAAFDFWFFQNYPFKLKEYLDPGAMPAHAVVNHIPLTIEFTQKATLMKLADAEGFAFVPHMQALPLSGPPAGGDAPAYLVTKNLGHRGVKLTRFEDALGLKEGVAQAYVERPLLVDGAKFDVGSYVLLLGGGSHGKEVSVRVLVFDEISLRFCAQDYPGGNGTRAPSADELLAAPSGALFVDDKFRSFWNLPSLRPHVDLGARRALRAAIGPQRLAQIDRGVASNAADVVSAALRRQAARIAGYPRSGEHFWQLVRMDNTVDADLNVFTVEINMSPNMIGYGPRQHQATGDDVTWRRRLMDATLRATAAWARGGSEGEAAVLPVGAPEGSAFREVRRLVVQTARDQATEAALDRMWS